MRKKTERESPTPAPCTTPQDGQARHRQQRLWPNSSHSPQQAAQAGGTSSTRGQGGHRPRHDTVHVRPHRAHITWLDHATPPTLPPALPLRHNNRPLARWVARGIYPQIRAHRHRGTRRLPTRGDLPPGHPFGPSHSSPKAKMGLCTCCLASHGDGGHEQERGDPAPPETRRISISVRATALQLEATGAS